MSASPTLNSRLRVLVAKTFRAEKLYSSIRNSCADKLSDLSTLTEIANDIRAKEWQRAHYCLRTSLNDILVLGNNGAIVAEIIQLREHFLEKVAENEAALNAGSETVMETIRRFEFAHSFRISVELIRQKAAAQANKVIADELSAVLEASGRNIAPGEVISSSTRSKAGYHAKTSQRFRQMPEFESDSPARSNVIPLKRRVVAGTRRGH